MGVRFGQRKLFSIAVAQGSSAPPLDLVTGIRAYIEAPGAYGFYCRLWGVNNATGVALVNAFLYGSIDGTTWVFLPSAIWAVFPAVTTVTIGKAVVGGIPRAETLPFTIVPAVGNSIMLGTFRYMGIDLTIAAGTQTPCTWELTPFSNWENPHAVIHNADQIY